MFLPCEKINTVIVSPEISEKSVESLRKLGISVLFSCESPNVLDALKFHTDMQIAFVGKNKAVCAPECYEYYQKLLIGYNCEILAGNTVLSCNYPGDIAYNIIVAENFAIHNFRHTDTEIMKHIKNKNLLNVSQGYTACTLCMINENSFITSDRGIYKTLSSAGKNVLVIDDSKICLNGFDHGFFGGASVMLSSDILAVNGNVFNLPDGEKICEFCNCAGINVVSLSDECVTDVGSIIPVA